MLTSKNILAFLLIILVTAFLFKHFSFDGKDQVQYSDFMELVQNRQVSSVQIQGDQVHFTLDQKRQLQTVIPDEITDFAYRLYQKGVRIQVKNPEEGSFLWAFLMQWLPILIIIAVWFFVFKFFQGGGSKIMSMNRFKIRELKESPQRYTFADVAGIDEAVDEVREIVDYMKQPEKFRKLGGKIPSGVLLCGSPGTGKTLLAKAIAGEANIGFFSISGSDFVEMFVGVGAGRVRELFTHARKKAPCIIFIDEIDAVGRSRGSGLGGGNDEREQTLNQLLVEMDGFNEKEGVLAIAATNRPDVLDPALTRSGRFDRTIIVPPPDVKGREKILEIHSQKVKLEKDVDLEIVARSLPGVTGADLENIVNEAALLAARHKKKKVGKLEFEEAHDKITMGTKRSTLIMSQKELETTAYHEAGHALIAALLDECDDLHKVTIIPRGRSLGVTMLLPDEQKHSMNKEKILAVLKMMMGGRGAEEIIYNHFTTGASNDLERASALAHDMICRWGMSDKLGPVYLNEDQQSIFLGREMKKKKMSESTSNLIDTEMKKIVNNAYSQTVKLLKKHKKSLEEITHLLLEHETISGSLVEETLKKNISSA